MLFPRIPVSSMLAKENDQTPAIVFEEVSNSLGFFGAGKNKATAAPREKPPLEPFFPTQEFLNRII